jgi:WD40 repeat protein
MNFKHIKSVMLVVGLAFASIGIGIVMTPADAQGQGDNFCIGEDVKEIFDVDLAWNSIGTKTASIVQCVDFEEYYIAQRIEIRDGASGTLIDTLTRDITSLLNSVTWRPNSEEVIVGNTSGMITRWDTASPTQPLSTLQVASVPLGRLSISNDGSRLLVGALDRKIRIVNLQSNLITEVPIVTGVENQFAATAWVAWSPNNQYFASGNADGFLRIWDAQSLNLIRSIEIVPGLARPYVVIGSWSPDNTNIAVVSAAYSYASTNKPSVYSAEIGVWNITTGTQVLVLNGHVDGSLNVAWSPEGNRIASIGEDGFLHIWDSQTGILLDSRLIVTNPRPGSEPLANLRWSATGGLVMGTIQQNMQNMPYVPLVIPPESLQTPPTPTPTDPSPTDTPPTSTPPSSSTPPASPTNSPSATPTPTAPPTSTPPTSPRAFQRGINFGSDALSIDGNAWEAGASAAMARLSAGVPDKPDCAAR